MAQASVSIRMDADLKRQFDEFCSEIGMTMTTAFCVFAKTAVRERKIPFVISAERSDDPFYSPEYGTSESIYRTDGSYWRNSA